MNSFNDFEMNKLIRKLKELEPNHYLLLLLDNESERIKNSVQDISIKFKEINLKKKLNQVEIIDRLLRDEKTYSCESTPIQGTADYLQFDITIKPKGDYKETLSNEKSKTFKHFEYLKGGVRYDFSVGVLFDFLTKDHTYEILNKDIVESSKNQFSPNLSGIIHASFRENGYFAFGVSFGLSLDVQKFDINLLFPGVSLLVGKRDKVIFTLGPSFRKITELKSQYRDENNRKNVTIEDISSATIQNFKVGMFFGITYNLTNKQRAALKIPNN